jgi:hypothetical protein
MDLCNNLTSVGIVSTFEQMSMVLVLSIFLYQLGLVIGSKVKIWLSLVGN